MLLLRIVLSFPEMTKLADITGERLDSMNEAGITMQVLSEENTDVNLLEDASASAFASKYNDLLAAMPAPSKQADQPAANSCSGLVPMRPAPGVESLV